MKYNLHLYVILIESPKPQETPWFVVVNWLIFTFMVQSKVKGLQY